MTHKEYMVTLLKQYEQKNAAYGNNAHKTFCRFGKAAYAMRLIDKVQRLEELTTRTDLDCGDESIQDTIGDAITYALMFAADLFCSENGKHLDITSERNFEKTKENIMLMASCPESSIRAMADVFEKTIMQDSNSLAYTVYAMYLEEGTTATDYILMSAYLIDMAVSRNLIQYSSN